MDGELHEKWNSGVETFQLRLELVDGFNGQHIFVGSRVLCFEIVPETENCSGEVHEEDDEEIQHSELLRRAEEDEAAHFSREKNLQLPELNLHLEEQTPPRRRR